MGAYTSTELVAILVQLVIVLLIVRRSYQMVQGAHYSLARLVVLPALILLLWLLTEFASVLLTPWAIPYLVTTDLAILVVTALAILRVAERMTHVQRSPDGAWTYRIGFSLAALFLGAFVIRLIVAIVLFPSTLGFAAPTGGFPPPQQQVVLAVIDALFSLSVGLLIGRAIGIQRAVRSAQARSHPSGST